MISNKIIGYVLLMAGLLLIGWTLWQSWNIFTAKVPAPLVFKTQAVLQTSGNNKALDLQQQLQKQLEDTIKGQIGQLLPADTLPKILNLASWSIFAFVLIFAGGATAGIGVKLIK